MYGCVALKMANMNIVVLWYVTPYSVVGLPTILGSYSILKTEATGSSEILVNCFYTDDRDSSLLRNTSNDLPDNSSYTLKMEAGGYPGILITIS